MSTHDQEDTIQQHQDDGSDATDLADALGGEEQSFVTEVKQPVNRSSLMVFGVLMLGVAGYYLMYLRTGPQSAAAASAEVQQADQTISQFLSAGAENIRVMQQLRQTTDKVVAQFRNSEVPQVPLTELQANPFQYARSKPGDPTADETASRKKQEQERQAAMKAVQALQLQSILHSDARRACMISNQLYGEGQTVGGFTVEQISPDAVIVKQGAYRFQLKMQR